MSEFDEFNWEEKERDLAELRLGELSRHELADFLDGNASPAFDIASHCTEENLPQLFQAIFAKLMVKNSDQDDVSDEDDVLLLQSAIAGLQSRFQGSGRLAGVMAGTIAKALRALHD